MLLFPSPLGVIVSLIEELLDISYDQIGFPSPLGVIFSLIDDIFYIADDGNFCFRLLSELYSLLCWAVVEVENIFGFPSPLGVIFSLIHH